MVEFPCHRATVMIEGMSQKWVKINCPPPTFLNLTAPGTNFFLNHPPCHPLHLSKDLIGCTQALRPERIPGSHFCSRLFKCAKVRPQFPPWSSSCRGFKVQSSDRFWYANEPLRRLHPFVCPCRHTPFSACNTCPRFCNWMHVGKKKF